MLSFLNNLKIAFLIVPNLMKSDKKLLDCSSTCSGEVDVVAHCVILFDWIRCLDAELLVRTALEGLDVTVLFVFVIWMVALLFGFGCAASITEAMFFCERSCSRSFLKMMQPQKLAGWSP